MSLGRPFPILLAALTSLAVVSCKGDWNAEYAKVRSACRMGDRQTATRITHELRKDEKFRVLFDAAVAEVGGARDLDFCNPMLLLAVETRINTPPP